LTILPDASSSTRSTVKSSPGDEFGLSFGESNVEKTVIIEARD